MPIGVPEAGRTPEESMPLEMQRQADRIEEQMGCLKVLLTKITDNIGTIKDTIGQKSPELTEQLELLKTAVSDYSGEATEIYTDVSESLRNYALNLAQNLEALRESISNITKSVNDLKSL